MQLKLGNAFKPKFTIGYNPLIGCCDRGSFAFNHIRSDMSFIQSLYKDLLLNLSEVSLALTDKLREEAGLLILSK